MEDKIELLDHIMEIAINLDIDIYHEDEEFYDKLCITDSISRISDTVFKIKQLIKKDIMKDKIQLKLFKKSGAMTDDNNFKTLTFSVVSEALEMAEYFYHNYLYQAKVIDADGYVYAEFEN